METLRKVSELRLYTGRWRAKGLSIGLVPTMGAIHDGHLSLVKYAQARCDKVIVTMFVNSKQFGKGEDIDTYPADEMRDTELLAETGADLLFAPSQSEVYPPDFDTCVTVSDLSAGLCGAYRPGHFEGVATVVTKLLLQSMPDIAVFGEKDYQQLLVIKRLVRDLDIGVQIVGAPTIREADGLAVSSRNVYLTLDERVIAPALYETLCGLAKTVADGGAECAVACQEAKSALIAAGFCKVDYVAVCDAITLKSLSRVEQPARILAAVHLGKARLIDNVAV